MSGSDEYWMALAVGWGRLAASRGDVPIGALVVRDGELLGAAHDAKEVFGDPTAHAEMQALQQAASRIGDWRLDNATLYVTLEPCPMCGGALLQSRIARLVYGASNVRWGIESAGLNLFNNPRFNHKVEVVKGVLEHDCATLLRDTFRSYRKK